MTVTASPLPGSPAAANPIAVIAHRGKTFGPGLDELRARLGADEAPAGLWWSEVDKSRQVPAQVRAAIEAGATRLIVWGGDGTVQRAVDAVRAHGADPDAVIFAVMPAGTANLFATNLGIPHDFDTALAIALGERTRRIDVGRVNGERFVVMAGTGLDAMMIRGTSSRLKHRLGRAGYVVAAARHVRHAGRPMTIKVDGQVWFDGQASCALVGNVGTLIGGLTVFDRADPTDGVFEVGVVTADSLRDWARLLGRAVVGSPSDSPLLTCTRGQRITVRLGVDAPYELDGGDRAPTRRLKFRIEPLALRVCVP